MSEDKKYFDPERNVFIRQTSDSEARPPRRHPDLILAEEVIQAARNVLIGGMECKSKIEMIDDEIIINGKRSINWEHEDLVPVLDAAAEQNKMIENLKREEEELRKAKYVDPEKNPMIKTDPD